jgi:fibronectin type 3 domain-containing protein
LVTYQGNTYKCVTAVSPANASWDPVNAPTVWTNVGAGNVATPTPVPATPPGVPQNVVATVNSTTQIAVTWSAVPSASSYNVYRCSGAGCTPTSLLTTVTAGATSPMHTNTGLTAGTTYRYNIKAVNSGGTSAASSIVTGVTSSSCTAPSVPGSLAATRISSSQINVSWNASTGSPTGYKLYRGTTVGFTPGGSNLIASPTGTTYSDTGLTANTTYYYKVASTNGTCDSQAQANGVGATTSASGGSYSAWDPNNHSYVFTPTPDRVSYNGVNYEALMAHSSNSSWDPASTIGILWKLI